MLILFSVALAMGAVELAARAFLPAWHPPEVGGVGFFRHDSLLGWSLRPSWKGPIELPSGTTHVRINAAGLRGDPLPATPAPGRRRILVLGDSFAFGFGVEREAAFDAVLQARHPELEMVNAGVPGYGTDQELLYLERRGLAWRPEAVVLLLHPNDVLNVSYARQYGYGKPLFLMVNGALRLTGVPVPPPRWSERLDVELLRRSWLLHHLYTLLAAPEPTQNLHAAPALAWDTMDALLVRMQSVLSRRGIPLLVVGIPWPDAATSKVVARLAESCRRGGVRYLSLEAAFQGRFERALEMATEHWTPEGHRLAAVALESELARMGLLGSPAAQSPASGSAR